MQKVDSQRLTTVQALMVVCDTSSIKNCKRSGFRPRRSVKPLIFKTHNMQVVSALAHARLPRRSTYTLARQLTSTTDGSVHVGTTFDLSKTFSREDVEQFLTTTGDSNPIHTDTQAAQLAGFDAPIIPGILLASLFPAVIGSRFPGAVYLSQSLNFRSPALVGHPVEAVVSVTKSSPKSGRMTFDTRCYAQDTRELLLDGKAMAIVPPGTNVK